MKTFIRNCRIVSPGVDLPTGNILLDGDRIVSVGKNVPDEADEITLPIQPGCKYLINVGSVGQPRNRDPRASFAVYDTEQRVLTRYRLPYDITGTQEKIRAAGLPECLATRLEHGL